MSKDGIPSPMWKLVRAAVEAGGWIIIVEHDSPTDDIEVTLRYVDGMAEDGAGAPPASAVCGPCLHDRHDLCFGPHEVGIACSCAHADGPEVTARWAWNPPGWRLDRCTYRKTFISRPLRVRLIDVHAIIEAYGRRA